MYQTAGCELNLAQLPNGFGVASLADFDPDIKRMYNIETRVSVQHELCRGVSVTGGWYHRDYHNLRRRDNTLQTFADYTPFTVYSPIDGTPITYYNVSNAARSRSTSTRTRRRAQDVVQRLRYTSAPALSAASRIFGGGMSERSIAQVATRSANPNLLLYCDQTQERHPLPDAVQDRRQRPDRLRHPGRFLVPEPARLRLRHRRLYGPRRRTDGPDRSPSATQLNTPNGAGTVWQITPTTALHCHDPCVAQGKCSVGQLVDPGMTVASLSVPLIAPNTEFGDRINQLDLNLSKTFKCGASASSRRLTSSTC